MLNHFSSLMKSAKKNSNYKMLSTMYEPLDNILDGGIPKGKIVEIYGEPDIGKTKLLFDIIENNSNNDTLIAYITTSRKSLYHLKARQLDKNENLIICVSNNEEDVINFIKSSVKIVDLFIIDSIAEILTTNEKHNMNMNEMQEMPKILNTINTILYGENSALIAINHVMFKNNKTVPKWNIAFQQYCTVRIEMKDDFSLSVISHKLRPDIVERIV